MRACAYACINASVRVSVRACQCARVCVSAYMCADVHEITGRRAGKGDSTSPWADNNLGDYQRTN